MEVIRFFFLNSDKAKEDSNILMKVWGSLSRYLLHFNLHSSYSKFVIDVKGGQQYFVEGLGICDISIFILHIQN